MKTSGALPLALISMLVAWPGAWAGEIVYQPINPAFGGNPFNGPYLLSNAQVQNDHKEESHGGSLGQSPVEQFERQITSRLLSRVSSEIADRIYGEEAADSGTFRIEDTVISFERLNGQVVLNIRNDLTGEQTTIEIPDPTF